MHSNKGHQNHTAVCFHANLTSLIFFFANRWELQFQSSTLGWSPWPSLQCVAPKHTFRGSPSFCISDDKKPVKIKAKVLQIEVEIEIVSNLLVAADGSFSSIRQKFLIGLKLRFLTKNEWKFVYLLFLIFLYPAYEF